MMGREKNGLGPAVHLIAAHVGLTVPPYVPLPTGVKLPASVDDLTASLVRPPILRRFAVTPLHKPSFARRVVVLIIVR
jgi:hypothetical protein